MHKRVWPKARMTALVMVLLGSFIILYPGMNVEANVAHGAVNSTDPYEWGSVAIGGGGYVTGIIAHPAEKDLVYIRTDVGGIFRWQEEEKTWNQLIGFADRSESNLYGGESIALDPQNPEVLYAALGKQDYWTPSDIFKSTDRGETWTATGLRNNGSYVKMAANGAQRTAGERLAVDPNNSDIVYFGSRYDGLFRTEEGAAPGSWEKVAGLAPTGAQVNGAPVGVSFVMFDPESDVIEGRTQTIYAGYYYYGVYVSYDAGETWELLPNSPLRPLRGAISSDGGQLYVTHYEGVVRLDTGMPDDGFIDITPEPESADNNNGSGQPFSAIAIAPDNNERVIVSRRQDAHNNPIYLSDNGGASWTRVVPDKHGLVPWTPGWHWSSATAAMAFDPFKPDRLWFTDWYYAWRTEDITPDDGSSPEFVNYAQGLETVVNVSNMVSPSSGEYLLHTGIADNGGFDHKSLHVFPDSTYFTGSDGLHELTTTGIAVSESHPEFIVRVGTYGWNGDGRAHPGNGGYSTDGGQTYTAFAALPYATAQGGRVAVSSTDTNRIVWMPQRGGVYYTADRGDTWVKASGVPSGLLSGDHIFANYYTPLAADTVNGNWFYVYDKGGKFYRSEDGGATWEETARLPGQATAWHNVEAAPGVMGEVWVSLNEAGLYRSSDAGDSFQAVEGVEEAFMFSFGKHAPGKLNPAVFVYGTLVGDETEGVFRSDDMGETWVRINVANPFPGNDPNAMTGDKQVHGRVYIGTNGSGIRYGALTSPLHEPEYEDQDAPDSPEDLTLTERLPAGLTFSWSASADADSGIKGYNIYVNHQWAASTWGTSYSLAGLEPDTEYELFVTAIDNAGNESEASAVVTERTGAEDEVPPGVPSGLKVDKSSSVLVKLAWQPNDEVDLAGYSIHRSQLAAFTPDLSNQIGFTTDTQYIDMDIEESQTYYYKLVAMDKAGNASGPTDSVQAITDKMTSMDIIVDNLDAGFEKEGSWPASTYSASRYGENYFHSGKEANSWAKWTPDIPVAGSYNVYMIWNASNDRDGAVPVTISHADGAEELTLNQKLSDNQWVYLGRYNFEEGMSGSVTLRANKGKTSIADAVKFSLDDSDPYGGTHPAAAGQTMGKP
ncbi:fibronectin type III domain-containing protein [Paenibacillus sanguinis]|uniref:golvesin C-terminal-like domain-containing protein n=1 Tax=Paenibacillus sanguinis TaxID=225906 RepID=UPI001F0B3059|nr:fibronectin type III domain-containing protein [Paenibacillus sanguinis]